MEKVNLKLQCRLLVWSNKLRFMTLRSRFEKDASETPKRIKRADRRHRTNLLSTALNLANLIGILNIS